MIVGSGVAVSVAVAVGVRVSVGVGVSVGGRVGVGMAVSVPETISRARASVVPGMSGVGGGGVAGAQAESPIASSVIHIMIFFIF